METTDVFGKNVIAYDNQCNLIINQGGSSSSKTYSILQLLFFIAFNQKKHRIISVVSYAFPHLRLGAIRDFDNILISNGIIPDEVRNKTDMTYRIGNSIIEFFGTENLGKVHGPRRDILFINEVNNVKYDIYTQLLIRTRECTFVDFNPTQRFWIHDEVIPKFDHTFIKSTYRDNNFLDLNTIKQIESRRGNTQWWQVYGEGEIGVLEGAIFNNWRYENDGECNEAFARIPYGHAMDFGFHPDPDSLNKIAVDSKHKKMYVDEMIYQNMLGLSELEAKMEGLIDKNKIIIADSSSPRMIYDLGKKFNIKGVVKGAGSVVEGIRLMQDYEIILSKRSYNLGKEFQNYVWSDKKSGIPIDAFNHGIDNIRYYLQTNTKKTTSRQQWRG
jgi:phage terminase large subunit